MSKSRRSFTAEWKVEAAHRVIDSGSTVAEVARELGAGEQLLGRWVRDERVRADAATAGGKALFGGYRTRGVRAASLALLLPRLGTAAVVCRNSLALDSRVILLL